MIDDILLNCKKRGRCSLIVLTLADCDDHFVLCDKCGRTLRQVKHLLYNDFYRRDMLMLGFIQIEPYELPQKLHRMRIELIKKREERDNGGKENG